MKQSRKQNNIISGHDSRNVEILIDWCWLLTNLESKWYYPKNYIKNGKSSKDDDDFIRVIAAHIFSQKWNIGKHKMEQIGF